MSVKEGRGLRIKFVPYESMKSDYSSVMKGLKENAIILVDAKLSPEEETDLIKETMKQISSTFKGIEMSSLDISETAQKGLGRIRNIFVEAVLGKKRGITIIGPAKIVRKIKKNPEDLLLYL